MKILVTLFLLLMAGGAQAQVPYIEKEIYWIPRSTTDQVNGPYQHMQPGGHKWVSSVTDVFRCIPGLCIYPLYLDPVLPAQLYLSGVWAQTGSSQPQGFINQLVCWVDPGGVQYNSAVPHGNEGGPNFSKVTPLFHLNYKDDFPLLYHKLDPPVLLDRDAGDLLVCELAISQYTDWLYVGFRYLVRNPHVGLP